MCETRPVIIVVDDDVSVREALDALIRSAGWAVQCFDCATAFLDWTPPAGPSCLLLDVGLPDLNGLELQARIASDRQSMPIIFITGRGDIPMTVRAMKAGAAEFLTKPFDDNALLAAIGQAIERSRAGISEQAALQSIRESYDSLSRREREVMALVVSGLLNKQVAFELGISEITVKVHRGRVMAKMHARSFADLIMMGASLGLQGPAVIP